MSADPHYYGSELRDLAHRVGGLQLDIGSDFADMSDRHLGQLQGALIAAKRALHQAEEALKHGLERAGVRAEEVQP